VGAAEADGSAPNQHPSGREGKGKGGEETRPRPLYLYMHIERGKM
jgi:hypothetical protein